MSTEKMQDEFEVWLANKTGNSAAEFKSWRTGNLQYGKTPGDGYARGGLEIGLESWIASRESLVIELPGLSGLNTSFVEDGIQKTREHNRYNSAVKHCREAIHTAGVKTK